MDFYQIKEKSTKNGVIEIYPDFKIGRSKDLMVRGKSFYAIWDEEKGLWSTDEYDVQRIVDKDLKEYKEKILSNSDGAVKPRFMSDFSSNSWSDFRKYMSHISDNAHQLDENLTFQNTEVKKKDYVSKRLPYPIEEGRIDAYEELMQTLYDEEERQKLEWAIGAIISGDSKDIQKFIVLYGEAGAGKSTFLNIVQKLFEGYYTTFEAKALTSASNTFSTEVFRSNPLVAIQHDGDLSRIEDNTKLNSIVSHEEMTMNEKYKPSYTARLNCFLFIGTNKPVKITDAKSGIIRRLIDVKPSGRRLPIKRYQALVSQIDFEIGAIANHCLNVYRTMGKNYYNAYKPLDMIYQTDVFFNFVESNYYIFKDEDGITLKQAYDMYKTYCDEALVDFKLPRHKFREELKNYFKSFSELARIEGKQVRSYYSDFMTERFTNIVNAEADDKPSSIVLDFNKSIFDETYHSCFAQYANEEGVPSKKWSYVKTRLSDLNTRELHYVKPPEKHIVIDFDLKDNKGNKSLERNLDAAAKWPPTYSELSKSGKGLHLHYIYDGDVKLLKTEYAKDIEIKVFTGNSSLRRKLTKCNNIPIMRINTGLPLKGEKMLNFEVVESEKKLRDMVTRNLNKEFHPDTTSSVNFIHKLLEDAYNSDLHYDLTDMRPKILAFASNSTNQSETCIKTVAKMKFRSEDISPPTTDYKSKELAFFDVEVFPNLFVLVWKFEGKKKVIMINPKPSEIEDILKLKLVGFNCRRYDNHILYARYLGYSNEELFNLSQRIIKGSPNSMFGEAYNISYTDIYDFSSLKQSLKKFQIELGLHHQELGLPWDQPVDEELWPLVAEYCGNDVDTTEAVFHSRKQDFIARLILSDLSGLTPNDTTQMHTARIIFGNDPKPQEKFVYTDLSIDFPGYRFERGVSSYREEDPKEGGYVYAEHGMYGNTVVLDVESMHPNSLINLNLFGPYTKNFKELVNARLAIKHKDYEIAKDMLGGTLEKYLDKPEDAKDLSYALKIVINIVYGLTSAKFDNKFRDPRNIDNIVAKRGALFMIDLKHAVQDRGYKVVHIKTDSIKIPDATPEIIQFVKDFGKDYGYSFEHETTYDKFCLVNDAVYVGKVGWSPDEKEIGTWETVGAQFAHPYVYKTLFSKEPIEFKDVCETKSVTTALYLDTNENLSEGDHDYHFIGKVGLFVPVLPGKGGGLLMREKDGKYYAATGSKGYRWMEATMVKELNKEDDIDYSYFEKLVEEAKKSINFHGNIDWFLGDKPYDQYDNEIWPF